MKNLKNTLSLNKIYRLCAGGFLILVLFLMVLEQQGLPIPVIGYLLGGFTILVYAIIGIISKTKQVEGFYQLSNNVSPVFNGMAAGAGWVSGASFIGLAGSLYFLGYDGLAFVLGWAGGYVLIAILLASHMHKLGAFTVPDFLGVRYQSRVARLLGVVVLIACTFVYLVAQMHIIGMVAEHFLGMPFNIALLIGLFSIIACTVLGGVQSLTWTQVAQYTVLIIAYIIPVFLLAFKVAGIIAPQLAYGSVLKNMVALEGKLNLATSYIEPFTHFNTLNYFLLIACLMLGTASLPHVLTRYFIVPKAKTATSSVAWSLLFIVLLYSTAPVYAVLVKYEIYSTVIGHNINNLPSWITALAQTEGVLRIEDFNQDGILQLNELNLKQNSIMQLIPAIVGLPYIVGGLMAAGFFAAALSTVNVLLLTITNAISHDVYYRTLNPQANPELRLMMSKALLVFIAAGATLLAYTQSVDILTTVTWSFSIAASGLFVPLVLGVWWSRITKAGAISGMVAGFLVCWWYLVVTRYFPQIGVGVFGMSIHNPSYGISANNVGYWGIINISAAALGVPVSLGVSVVVSLFTEAPTEKMKAVILKLRTASDD